MRPAVLFDVDGTLVDTNYLHALAWRRAFLDHGFDIPTAEVHRRVGMGSDRLMRELLGAERDDVSEGRRRHFDALKPEIRALPGARELLEDVARRGGRVVLATSSEEGDVEALLDALDPGDEVLAVTSSGDVEEAKPAPDVFRAALDKAGTPPEAALAVGDTVWDVEAARRSGLDCVTVMTGGISRLELLDAGAAAVYHDLNELREGLDDSPIGKLLRSGS
jgi:HAD superfamily hydrolase (TIGR01509 family)